MNRYIPIVAAMLLMLLTSGSALAASQGYGQPPGPPPSQSDDPALGNQDTYGKNEILQKAERFFAGTSEGLADVIERVFRDQGQPVGYIEGTEGGGAFIVGLRYGEGTMFMKSGQRRKVYWQGPSVGFDWGGNFSKVFTLVYSMRNPDSIYRRYPGVDGSVYIVGGFSMNYQQLDHVILAPIRTGVGLRLGANVGYLHYTPEEHYNPF